MNRPLTYDYDAGFDDPGDKNAWFALRIGHDQRVLEIGCATGYVGEHLAREFGCAVTGVELIPEAAEKARARGCYERLVVGDIHDQVVLDELGGSRFDVVLFGDVIEHLIDPVRVLRSTSGLLSDDGRVLLCVPNVVHWSMRIRILRGRFDYTDTGILDRTHLRFYTPDTLRALAGEAGLAVTDSAGVVWLPRALHRLPARLLERVEATAARLAPNLAYGQTLLALRPVRRTR